VSGGEAVPEIKPRSAEITNNLYLLIAMTKKQYLNLNFKVI
jgi:hypothetical protein